MGRKGADFGVELGAVIDYLRRREMHHLYRYSDFISMMKAFGFLVFVAALICLCLPSFPPPDRGGASRKLKENINDYYKVDAAGDVNLLDYHRNDPVPNSKATINHGPIQHGSPLIPYIPNPPPLGLNHPNHVDVVFP